MDKKITFRVIQNRNYEFLKKIFPKKSDSHAFEITFNEIINSFRNTLENELKIFNDEEIYNLSDCFYEIYMDFTINSAKKFILHETKNYYMFILNKEIEPEFLNKLEKLTDFQAFVLCRWLKSICNSNNSDKAIFFFGEIK